MQNKFIIPASSKRIPLTFVLFCIFMIAITLSTHAETLNYLEKTGDNSAKLIWNITGKPSALSLAVGENEIAYTTEYTDVLSAKKWSFKNTKENTSIVAVRKNNSIAIKGLFNGEDINKTIGINKLPWYQPLSFSLRSFIKSKKRVIVFWTINPKTLLAYKMKAQKVGIEALSVQNRKVQAQKVKVSLSGPKSMFWHSYYWFGINDGLFLRYEGVNGPPGTPQTTTTLTGIEQ